MMMSLPQRAEAESRSVTREYHRHTAIEWLRFTGQRLIAALLATVALVIAVFFIIRLIPGDPARRIAGADATPELVAQLQEELGLTGPLWSQFTEFLRRILQWDFGDSLVTGQPVSDVIAERLPFTMELALSGLLVACILGALMGVGAAALTRDGKHPRFERIFVRLSGGLGAIPEISIATALVAVFAVSMGVAPVSGVQGLPSLILPSLAVGVRPAFNLARIIRVEMLEVLRQPYMRTASSKRLSGLRTYIVHALPNAMTPILTLFGLLFANLVGGIVVVETLFAWPGIGSALVKSVLDLDYPVIQGLVALVGLIVIVSNVVVDLLIGAFDKRVVLGLRKGAQ